jgi:hypothetical protein
MERITHYIPTIVGPSKLDQVLSYCNELSDEDKEKVTILTDLARMMKAMNYPPIKPESFYNLYESPLYILTATQMSVTVDYNSFMYAQRVHAQQGKD